MWRNCQSGLMRHVSDLHWLWLHDLRSFSRGTCPCYRYHWCPHNDLLMSPSYCRLPLISKLSILQIMTDTNGINDLACAFMESSIKCWQGNSYYMAWVMCLILEYQNRDPFFLFTTFKYCVICVKVTSMIGPNSVFYPVGVHIEFVVIK